MLLEHHKEMHAHSGSVLDLPPPLVIEPREEDAEDFNDSIQVLHLHLQQHQRTKQKDVACNVIISFNNVIVSSNTNA